MFFFPGKSIIIVFPFGYQLIYILTGVSTLAIYSGCETIGQIGLNGAVCEERPKKCYVYCLHLQ